MPNLRKTLSLVLNEEFSFYLDHLNFSTLEKGIHLNHPYIENIEISYDAGTGRISAYIETRGMGFFVSLDINDWYVDSPHDINKLEQE